MTINAALKELKSHGTAQNRKVYARHGVKREMFGVSFAHLKAMAKKIKVDHDLAVALWNSGNHDARVLATMIADAAAFDAKTLDAWAKAADNYIIADSLSGLVGRSKHAQAKAEKWHMSKDEFVGQIGWNLVNLLAMDAGVCEDAFFEPYMQQIERDIHKHGNRTRHAMNMALCGIGIYREGLRERALAVAGQIGKVEVDHGETGCKTPDAAAYIRKAVATRSKKKSRKSAR